VPKRLNSLKFYHNKNENPIENLYDMISLVKIKREFLFTPGREPLNCFP